MLVNEKLCSLEKEAMEMLIMQHEESKDVLLNQLSIATVVSRDFSGSGFFTHYAVPSNSLKANGSLTTPIGGVYAKISGLEIGVGFLLYLKDGQISTLECYEYDSAEFPKEITDYTLSYVL